MVKGAKKSKSNSTKASKQLKQLVSGNTKRGKRNLSHQRKLKETGKYSKIIKSLELTDNFLDPSVTELINSLDTPLTDQDTKYKDIFQVPFESNITIRQFYKLFLHGINYAKNNYEKKSLKILKRMLIMLKDMSTNIEKDDELGISAYPNPLYQKFKIDFILTLLSDENKIKSLNIKNIKDTDNAFKSLSSYCILSDPKRFDDATSYNNNITSDYSPKNFEQILYSPVILNAYGYILKDLYKISLDNYIIKTTLKDYLKKHEIFFIMMDPSMYGLILFDGTILLNKQFTYYNQSDKQGTFKIFFTLLHELMHALSRLFRGDNNFFIYTGEFFKKNKNAIIEESGNYFDQKILLDKLEKPELSMKEIEYLLEPKNYNYNSVDVFKMHFIDYRKKKH